MWAGGSIRSLGPLRVGEPATRSSRVLETIEKQGRSGRLVFVTVGHTILQRGEVVVEERQHILYRDADAQPLSQPGSQPGSSTAHPPPRQEVEPGEWSVPVSPVLLFRFSALTYNGHRIHYDRDYARSQEGYAGLVVHGPLQAMVMAETARARGAPETSSTTGWWRRCSRAKASSRAPSARTGTPVCLSVTTGVASRPRGPSRTRPRRRTAHSTLCRELPTAQRTRTPPCGQDRAEGRGESAGRGDALLRGE